MTTLGIVVFFLCGSLFGIFYGAMASLGIGYSSGLHSSTYGKLTLEAGTYYLSFMLLLPIIAGIYMAIAEGGPGTIGFAITSTAMIVHFVYTVYKRLRTERLSNNN